MYLPHFGQDPESKKKVVAILAHLCYWNEMNHGTAPWSIGMPVEKWSFITFFKGSHRPRVGSLASETGPQFGWKMRLQPPGTQTGETSCLWLRHREL